MNSKLLSILLLASFSFANDPIQTYQEVGIKALEASYDKILASKSYWDDRIGDKNISMGYYSDFDTILYCNKERAVIARYSIDSNHSVKAAHKNSTFLGKKAGDKQVEGDLKTPVGVYKLTKKLAHVDPFYGPLALVTNYPNNYDKVLGKNGSGIWIHGLPFEGDRDTFTKGCLAIDNQELVDLEKSIDHKKTALLISPSKLITMKKEQLSAILSQLYKWRNAWKYNNLEEYLSFYNKNFKRYDHVGLTQFKLFKENIFTNKFKKQIDFNHINVIPYPNEENRNIFVISFIEDYKARNTSFHGFKELYVELQDNNISILTEK